MAIRGTEAPVPSGTGDTGRLTHWLAVGAGAVAWSLHLIVSYALLGVACALDNAWILHAVTLATFVATAVGGWFSYRLWRRSRPLVGPSPSGRRAEYEQFMGLSGVLLNAMFGFAILLEGLPVAFLGPCLGFP